MWRMLKTGPGKDRGRKADVMNKDQKPETKAGAARVDIVDAIGFGYRLAWVERRYLLGLALLPILVKFITQILVVTFGMGELYVRQALIGLPAYFVEGWMLSHIVRLVLFNQRWPFRPTGDMAQDVIVLGMRARGILAGTVMYVLIRYMLTGLFGLMQQARNAAHRATEQGGTIAEMGNIGDAASMQSAPGAFFAALALLFIMLWAFRFMWFYIPAAADIGVGAFMRKTWRFMTSIHMMGIWLMSSIPLFFVLSIVAGAFLGEAALSRDSGFAMFTFTFLWVLTDVATMLITTASMAYAYRVVMRDVALGEGGR